MILAVMDTINCVEKPEKFRTWKGFELVTSRYEGLLGSLFNIQFGYNEVINYVR